MASWQEADGLKIKVCDICWQPEEVIRKGLWGRAGRVQTGNVECKSTCQKLKPAFTIIRTVADPCSLDTRRSLFLQQAFDILRTGAMPCNVKERQHAFLC